MKHPIRLPPWPDPWEVERAVKAINERRPWEGVSDDGHEKLLARVIQNLDAEVRLLKRKIENMEDRII